MEKIYGTGWRPDFPDYRDFGLATFNKASNKQSIKSKIEQQENSNLPNKEESLFFDLKVKNPPGQIDLRAFCSEVRDQGEIGSCTAFAGISLIEYFEKRSKGSYIPASPLFLYKATRNYMKYAGDSGADPRNTMAAMVLFGVPPEKYYEYNQVNYDLEPPAFLYSFAQNYKTVKFFRYDFPGSITKEDTLKSVKLGLANGIPVMCGFTLYSSWQQSKNKDILSSGRIPFPGKYDSKVNGHAISIFGYDDSMKIINQADKIVYEGAFLFKNSWGKDWGLEGYGWLPYEYLKTGLAIDWWSIIKHEWINTESFENVTPNN